MKEVIEHLKSYPPEMHVAVAIWQVCDVQERAKERGIKLTTEQVEAIIDRMHRKQDATLGISWDTIDCYIDDCLET